MRASGKSNLGGMKMLRLCNGLRTATTVLLLALLVSGCTVTREARDKSYNAQLPDRSIVVMPPDVAVTALTAGGVHEFREDWTREAEASLNGALKSTPRLKESDVKLLSIDALGAEQRSQVRQSTLLWSAVGDAIAVHKMGLLPLPTKEKTFDWTLGESALPVGRMTGARFALYISASDSFQTAGRVALQVMVMAGCAVGVCNPIEAGMRRANAALVDLQTGQVVWFNHLESGVGDIRSPEGAEKLLWRLLETLPTRDSGKRK